MLSERCKWQKRWFKEFSVQENNIEMYINMGKKLLSHTFFQTNSTRNWFKDKDTKNQPCIDKNPKIAGKHQQKNIPKNTHQTCSPSKLAGWEKKERKFLKKYQENCH